VGFQLVPAPSRQVKLANGKILVTDQVVPQMEWWCQGNTLCTDMQALDLGAYDAILGYNRLKKHSPMTCDWEHQTVTFMEQDKLITLQGVPPAPLSLSAVQADSL